MKYSSSNSTFATSFPSRSTIRHETGKPSLYEELESIVIEFDSCSFEPNL